MQIFVHSHVAQMQSYRRQLKEQAGDRYETMVAPYRSVLLTHCKKADLEPYLGAKNLLVWMAQKRKQAGRKLEPHVKAAMFAAAMDIEERKLMDQKT